MAYAPSSYRPKMENNGNTRRMNDHAGGRRSLGLALSLASVVFAVGGLFLHASIALLLLAVLVGVLGVRLFFLWLGAKPVAGAAGYTIPNREPWSPTLEPAITAGQTGPLSNTFASEQSMPAEPPVYVAPLQSLIAPAYPAPAAPAYVRPGTYMPAQFHQEQPVAQRGEPIGAVCSD